MKLSGIGAPIMAQLSGARLRAAEYCDTNKSIAMNPN
jgi:hypothetical protein